MKNKTGLISGFILGAAGFLLGFRFVFLPRIAPSDELAPGVVMIIAAVIGAFCAFAGVRIQAMLEKKGS